MTPIIRPLILEFRVLVFILGTYSVVYSVAYESDMSRMP